MKNKFFTFTIVFVLITLSLTINYYFNNKKFMSTYVSEVNSLDQTIANNQKLLESLDSDIAYNSSKEFIEKIAREKLGLVMEDEIVFIEH